MKSLTRSTLAAIVLAALSLHLQAQEAPQMPKPTKEHEWLKKFVGDWTSETSIHMEPDKPPLKAQGTETVKSLGGFWIVSEGKSEMMGQPFLFNLTLGYDADTKTYTGTWVDSMNGYLWKYSGSVDASGNKLTLESEGPCPMEPGKMFKFKEVTEFKSDSERTFTSSMQGSDGKWTTLVTGVSKKK